MPAPSDSKPIEKRTSGGALRPVNSSPLLVQQSPSVGASPSTGSLTLVGSIVGPNSASYSGSPHVPVSTTSNILHLPNNIVVQSSSAVSPSRAVALSPKESSLSYLHTASVHNEHRSQSDSPALAVAQHGLGDGNGTDWVKRAPKMSPASGASQLRLAQHGTNGRGSLSTSALPAKLKRARLKTQLNGTVPKLHVRKNPPSSSTAALPPPNSHLQTGIITHFIDGFLIQESLVPFEVLPPGAERDRANGTTNGSDGADARRCVECGARQSAACRPGRRGYRFCTKECSKRYRDARRRKSPHFTFPTALAPAVCSAASLRPSQLSPQPHHLPPGQPACSAPPSVFPPHVTVLSTASTTCATSAGVRPVADSALKAGGALKASGSADGAAERRQSVVAATTSSASAAGALTSPLAVTPVTATSMICCATYTTPAAPALRSPATLPCGAPSSWSVDDVFQLVLSVAGCAAYAGDFRAQEIDGPALLLLTEEPLVKAMGLKLGPALKLLDRLHSFKP